MPLTDVPYHGSGVETLQIHSDATVCVTVFGQGLVLIRVVRLSLRITLNLLFQHISISSSTLSTFVC